MADRFQADRNLRKMLINIQLIITCILYVYINIYSHFANRFRGFEVAVTLPKEIKQLIFTFTDLSLVDVLSLQRVSSEFKKLCWFWLRDYDTSALVDKERTPIVAAYFITRVNANNIRTINFTHYDKPMESALKIMKTFPNLEMIDMGELHRKWERDDFLLLAEHHSKLREVRFGYFERSYRADTGVKKKNGFIPKPFESDFGPFYQQKPIAFHRAYHRGGPIGSNMHVIGATDGTLTFLTLDAANNNLQVHSTDNTSHKDCINSIWYSPISETSSEPNRMTYIASSDGIVTSWSCEDDKPVLKQTLLFPESILFVCDHADKYVLAAGKRTLYIAEIETSKIIKELRTDDDITGLVSVGSTANLSSSTNLFNINKDVTSDDVLQKVTEMSLPNIWLSPNASLMMVVRETKIHLIERQSGQEFPATVDAYHSSKKIDTRPHLARFSTMQFWMLVSTGAKLIGYDLTNRSEFAQLTACVSPLELDPEHPPMCNAFWYAPCSTYFFGLYSNNTLYWWRVLVPA